MQVQVFVTEPNPTGLSRDEFGFSRDLRYLLKRLEAPEGRSEYVAPENAAGYRCRYGAPQLFHFSAFGTELDNQATWIAVPGADGSEGRAVLFRSRSYATICLLQPQFLSLCSGTAGTDYLLLRPVSLSARNGDIHQGVGFDPSCQVDINEAKIASNRLHKPDFDPG